MADRFSGERLSVEEGATPLFRPESAPVSEYVDFSWLETDRMIGRLVAIPDLAMTREDRAQIAGSYDRMARKMLERLAARPENAPLYTRLKWAIEKLEQEFPEISQGGRHAS